MMKRNEVIQAVLDCFESPAYLEVGVFHGQTFHKLEAAEKVAVDPNFRFDVDAARAENPNAQYHRLPSDAYFATCEGRFFEVVFLDGLHTFEQTLRDLMNAVAHLAPGGVIIIDDVKPTSYGASLPELGQIKLVKAELNEDNNWMGDVYRLVYFIESFMPSYDYATVAENHGQLLMWRAPRHSIEYRSVESISRKTFADLLHEIDVLKIKPLAQILRDARLATDTLEGGSATQPQ